MLSNTILQSTLEGVHSISGCDFFVMNPEGEVLAGTYAPAQQQTSAAFLRFVDSEEMVSHLGSLWFFKVCNHEMDKVVSQGTPEYILAAPDTFASVSEVGRLAAYQLETLLCAYQKRFDKDSYIKNLLLDNMLLVDIYSRAKRLQIENQSPRVVYYIETQGADNEDSSALHEIVRSLYPSRDLDFVTTSDDSHLILVKNFASSDVNEDEIRRVAEVILDMTSSELMSSVSVAYGGLANDLKDLSRSYKEAKMALEVGHIFYPGSRVISFNHLGIGRLIYQLPLSFCHSFIDEIFKNGSLDDIDAEDINTINCFFENNMITSETARQLFIHRNTLVYRLNRLENMTGLDIRKFEDAITFRIALMVSQYLKYMEKNEF